jgi:hypothetical protein
MAGHERRQLNFGTHLTMGLIPICRGGLRKIGTKIPNVFASGTGRLARPVQVTAPGGRILPGVPSNAIGGYPAEGKGFIYPLETSGALDSRLTHIRVMDPVLTGKYTYTPMVT